MVRTSVFAALKVTLHKSDHISNWRRSFDNIVCKALGFLEEHKSIVSSANREIEDLMFVPMSLTYTRKVRDQVRILEARHSLYANGQNENIQNGQIATYLIGTTEVSYKQNPSRQADAIWKEGRNEWLCQKF